MMVPIVESGGAYQYQYPDERRVLNEANESGPEEILFILSVVYRQFPAKSKLRRSLYGYFMMTP